MTNNTEEIPWELAEVDDWAPYQWGNLPKIATALVTLGAFFTVGLILL